MTVISLKDRGIPAALERATASVLEDIEGNENDLTGFAIVVTTKSGSYYGSLHNGDCPAVVFPEFIKVHLQHMLSQDVSE